MALSDREIRTLVSAVAKTRDQEIDCDACLRDMSEFAEANLVGSSLTEALRLVRDHIETCPECEEEYRALLVAMRGC